MHYNLAESAGVIETDGSGKQREKPGLVLKTRRDNEYI